MNLLCWRMAPSSRVTRKWEVFAGRNKFYCDGYLMSAPHTGVFYFTVFLITFTSTLFFAFDCPYLAVRITLAIPIIGGCLYVFTMGALLRTTFTDPGVIPRASQDEAAYIEKQIEVPNSLNSPTFRPPPRTKEVLVKGQTVKLKYCFTCKIFRPPRASHCSLCDNCVDRFDHHCPWVGNCVGKRNYRFFYMFIVSLAFLAVFIFSCSLTHLILLAKDDDKQEFVDVIRQAPFSLVSSFICFLSIWSVIGLAGFHTYLTTSDQTTNEDIKGSFSSKGGSNTVNPYSHGNICLNCFYILCGPMTPSLIDRRGIVTDEYRIQMQQSDRYHTPTLHVPVTAQPLSASDQAAKANFYDIESGPPALLNNGVYRQRSYDNLQNGHSTSVAHLVENELPLSNVSSPSAEAAVDQQQQQPQHHRQSTLDILGGDGGDGLRLGGRSDDDSTENLSNRNNLSGSYSNLYRGDKLDGDDDDVLEIGSPDVRERRSSAVVAAHADGQHQGQGLVAGRAENVYSNVPFVGGVAGAAADSGAATHQSQPQLNDPNQHVYSNISSAQQQLANSSAIGPGTPLSASQPQLDFSFGGMSAIHGTPAKKSASSSATSNTTPTIVAQSFVVAQPSLTSGSSLAASHISSTMMADDLDLDDPVVTAASAFAMSPKRSKTTTTTTTANGAADERHPAAIEMKNVIPQVSVPNGAQSTAAATGTAANSNVIAANAFCSPSRMRLLHDTTMIDTALDLDSLDGSSLGTNSQACLVNKTAIV